MQTGESRRRKKTPNRRSDAPRSTVRCSVPAASSIPGPCAAGQAEHRRGTGNHPPVSAPGPHQAGAPSIDRTEENQGRNAGRGRVADCLTACALPTGGHPQPGRGSCRSRIPAPFPPSTDTRPRRLPGGDRWSQVPRADMPCPVPSGLGVGSEASGKLDTQTTSRRGEARRGERDCSARPTRTS